MVGRAVGLDQIVHRRALGVRWVNGAPQVELVDHSHDAVPSPTFGASLRAARLSRNISLDAVAAHTKINRSFFRDLECDDLSKWPSNQFYCESYLRAYALAIGLNPRDVIDGFRREIATRGPSNAALPSSRTRRLTPVTIPIILAVTFIVAYSLARWLAPAVSAPEPPADATREATTAAPAGVDSVNVPKAETSPKEPAAPLPSAVAAVDLEQIEGELVITSTPEGARVLVNGIARGSTPATVQHLAPGTYAIRFIHPGHASVTRQATISPERRRVRVSVTLEPVDSAQSSVLSSQ
jgi:cytoskeletal protein RodZ